MLSHFGEFHHKKYLMGNNLNEDAFYTELEVE